jgi:hypothetical protein
LRLGNRADDAENEDNSRCGEYEQTLFHSDLLYKDHVPKADCTIKKENAKSILWRSSRSHLSNDSADLGQNSLPPDVPQSMYRMRLPASGTLIERLTTETLRCAGPSILRLVKAAPS